MVDIDRLRQVVYNFSFYSKPSNADSSTLCTVGDINKVIQNISDVLNVFIDELEGEE